MLAQVQARLATQRLPQGSCLHRGTGMKRTRSGEAKPVEAEPAEATAVEAKPVEADL